MHACTFLSTFLQRHLTVVEDGVYSEFVIQAYLHLLGMTNVDEVCALCAACCQAPEREEKRR